MKVKIKESFGSNEFLKRFVGSVGQQKEEVGASGKTVAVDFGTGSRLYVEPEHLEVIG